MRKCLCCPRILKEQDLIGGKCQECINKERALEGNRRQMDNVSELLYDAEIRSKKFNEEREKEEEKKRGGLVRER